MTPDHALGYLRGWLAAEQFAAAFRSDVRELVERAYAPAFEALDVLEAGLGQGFAPEPETSPNGLAARPPEPAARPAVPPALPLDQLLRAATEAGAAGGWAAMPVEPGDYTGAAADTFEALVEDWGARSHLVKDLRLELVAGGRFLAWKDPVSALAVTRQWRAGFHAWREEHCAAGWHDLRADVIRGVLRCENCNAIRPRIEA